MSIYGWPDLGLTAPVKTLYTFYYINHKGLFLQTKTPNNQMNTQWPMRLVLLILLLQLSSLLTAAINEPRKVNSVISEKISQLIDINHLGHLQSIQTTQIGPLTFFKLKFFKHNNYQVSAKATQLFGFSPTITCVSGSKNHICQ